MDPTVELRCKFRLDRVATNGDGSRTVTLWASCQTDGDNKDWSQWTPSGQLMFTVTNPAAFTKIDAMKPGDHYYLDLTPVSRFVIQNAQSGERAIVQDVPADPADQRPVHYQAGAVQVSPDDFNRLVRDHSTRPPGPHMPPRPPGPPPVA